VTNEFEDVANDMLRGAEQIRVFVKAKNTDEIYYAARTKKLPIDKWGKELIASKRRLTNHLRKLLQGS
jgi:hypothetical protein